MEWWESVDRDEVIEGIRRLVPGGGCLVLRGSDLAGGYQALSLAQSVFDDFGYTCHRVAVSRGVTSTRSLFFRAWEMLGPRPLPSEIPPWVARRGSATEAELIDRLGELVHASSVRVAMLFEAVDRDHGLTAQDCSVFQVLASRASCPVVVSSNVASGSLWSQATVDVLDLGDFGRQDIWQCLQRSTAIAQKTSTELEEILEAVCHGLPDGAMPPLTVYTRLKAVAG
jgi:hypothetical protein